MALEYLTELDQLMEAKPSVFEVKGQSIGLIRTSDKVYAVRNVCPHKQAPVCKGTMRGTMLPSEPGTFVFGMENQVLQCPWHGWEFDLENRPDAMPIEKSSEGLPGYGARPVSLSRSVVTIKEAAHGGDYQEHDGSADRSCDR